MEKLIRKYIRKILSEQLINEVGESVKKLMDDLELKYNVDLFIYYNKFANTIILSKIVIPKKERSHGTGTKIMDEICDFADKNNLRVALTPSSDFGGSKTRLNSFYRRFEFKPYKGFEFREAMVRLPHIY